ncbi:MAG: 2-C-methyl-D-erythritol 4-phosphate cytidylyltransferase [Niabella sp.]|nr:2-C-methyl-D-erythritol 4-phosphate cytidylyltransferase [Niabella sp.]
MKKTAVIVAGGAGMRMGAELPKQFLLLKNRPLLYYTIDTFLKTYEDLDIVLVLPEAYTDMGQEIIDAYFDKDRVRITIGGATRFESVKYGLQLVEGEAIIFVHDAVRCLVSPELIRRCYEQAVETGSAIPVIAASDSVRLLTEDGSDALDREKVVLVQTPQVFHSKLLIPAFSIEQKEKFTDEASVVEAFGMKVSLVAGEKNNIKITHPVDLMIAAQLLDEA